MGGGLYLTLTLQELRYGALSIESSS